MSTTSKEMGGTMAKTEASLASNRRYKMRNKDKVREAGHRYYQENKAAIQERQRRYRASKRDQHEVREQVMVAISTGEIPHPETLMCCIGFDSCRGKATQYHHVDYSKPLDVFPVCQSCHQRWHAGNPQWK